MIWFTAFLGAVSAPRSSSQLQAPTPVNIVSWTYTHQVPPPAAWDKGTSWPFLIRLTVRPNGKLKRCEVEKSTANEYLTQFVCEMFKERAKLRPAVWTDGSPSFGVFRFGFVYSRDQAPPDDYHFEDLSVTIDRGIYAQRVPANVRVMFAVDANGQISGCTSQPRWYSSIANDPPAIIAVACEAVVHRYHPTPAKDGSGNPVRSVQNASVTVTSN